MTDAQPGLSPTRRRRAIIAVGCCVAAIIAIIVLGVVLSENVVYFRTVSEAVHARAQQGDTRFRLAGKVVPGSITETDRGVRFEVTDGKATVVVVHRGDPPELFKECVPVVSEGHWSRGAAFDSDRILIRHGNEYTPPKVNAKRSGCAT